MHTMRMPEMSSQKLVARLYICSANKSEYSYPCMLLLSHHIPVVGVARGWPRDYIAILDLLRPVHAYYSRAVGTQPRSYVGTTFGA